MLTTLGNSVSPAGQILKRRATRSVRERVPAILLVLLVVWLVRPACADELSDARKLLQTGKYSEAIAAAEKGAKRRKAARTGASCSCRRIWPSASFNRRTPR